MTINPLVGKPAEQKMLVNIPRLVTAYYRGIPDDPGEIYNELTKEFGEPFYDRIEAKATPEQKKKLSRNFSGTESQIKDKDLAGKKNKNILTKSSGYNAPIGGLKVIPENSRFAARPSGTEDIYKIYAESFLSKSHLNKIIEEAQTFVNAAL